MRVPRSVTSPNLIVVTVDCLRRDRISAYGYDRSTTPFLDGLLEDALHAPSAHATSSWTCPSVCSLLTGLYPRRHGGGVVLGEPKNLSRRNLPTKLPPEVPTVADRLRARGYATAAIGAVWNAHLPLGGRFDEMSMIEKPAPRLLDEGLRWIARRDGPFFLWLHLGDTHEPLDVPSDLRDVFGKIGRVRRVRTWDFTRSDDDVASEAFDRYREARTRLYDAAVRSVDRSLESFVTTLQSSGVADRTYLVVTSDHGEEFWEHRADELASFADPRNVFGVGHGHNLFQVHLLVPLIVMGPGVPVGAVPGNVSLVDVAPTLLEAVGEPTDELDGAPLWRRADDRPVFAESIAYGFEKRAVVHGDVKLLSAPGDGAERVYRLGADRSEIGLVQDEIVAAQLRALLSEEPAVVGDPTEATEEIEQHLRDLGYID